MSGNTLSEILETYGPFESPRTDKIGKEKILKWMQDEDVEALGALFHFLSKPEMYSRIVPYLTYEDHHDFWLRYFEKCLLEDPDGDWADSRYGAGNTLTNLFIELWKDNQVPRKKLLEIKRWLGKLYKSSNDEVRLAIVQGTLEHLFEYPELRKYFAEWKKDPALRTAYSEALDWPRYGRSERKGKL